MNYLCLMMKSFFLKLAFSCTLLGSVELSAQLGENVYPFLNLPTSARQSALGGDAVSFYGDDVSMLAVNPALQNEDTHQRIALNAASYLADSKYGTLAYAHAFDNGHHFIHGFARYMNYGTIPRTDEAGFENGTFGAFDATIGIGYAYNVEKEWTVGVNVKYINSQIDTFTSMAVAGDIGVTYHLEKSKETLAIVARNFGYQFKTFNGYRERLPFRVDVGYTKILEKFPAAITITAHDLQKFNISVPYNTNGQEVSIGRKIADHFSFGVELFPEKNFQLRAGYNIRRGTELAIAEQRSFAGLSFGFGLQLNRFKIDYTHARYHSAGNLNLIGIQVDISNNRYF